MYSTITLDQDHTGVFVHYNEDLDDMTFDLEKDPLHSSAYMYHVY